ncbi:MAG: hypothetical protein KAI66_23365 [Lentisphaeria bacterium]|nr:hypothetical protein [Lentisphaeria bacterium]
MGSSRRIRGSRAQKILGYAVRDDGEVGLRIAGLRRDFARFRRTHSPRTRIPDGLRQATLEVLDSGIEENEVRRVCGVTSDQVAQWRKHPQAREPERPLQRQELRVFPVVDDFAAARHGGEPAPQKQDLELELRLGDWTLCIRQRQR